MSISGISASGFFAGYNSTSVQNKFQQIQQGFQQLGQDLQSGNLSQAQSDFSALQQLLPSQQQTAANTAQTGAQSNNPIFRPSRSWARTFNPAIFPQPSRISRRFSRM